MAQIFKGTEAKFAISLTAPGFSMDADDFEIEVASNFESVKGYKNPPQGASTDVVVFKETVGGTSTWYAIVDTNAFTRIGDLRVIATAHIVDAKAAGGVRDEIARASLGTLVNP